MLKYHVSCPSSGENILKYPAMCPLSGENVMKYVVRCPLSGENLIECPLGFKFKFFICHVQNNYNEAVTGNEILNSQVPSNITHTIYV